MKNLLNGKCIEMRVLLLHLPKYLLSSSFGRQSVGQGLLSGIVVSGKR